MFELQMKIGWSSLAAIVCATMVTNRVIRWVHNEAVKAREEKEEQNV